MTGAHVLSHVEEGNRAGQPWGWRGHIIVKYYHRGRECQGDSCEPDGADQVILPHAFQPPLLDILQELRACGTDSCPAAVEIPTACGLTQGGSVRVINGQHYQA